MQATIKQWAVYLAIVLLLVQTVFGSLPVVALTNSSLFHVTMTTNGQPYTEGDVAEAPVEIYAMATSADSSQIEFSRDEVQWTVYDDSEPLLVTEEGNSTIWFRYVRANGEIAEKQSYTVHIATPVLPQLMNLSTPTSIIYVNANNENDTKDGTSWQTAYQDVQSALGVAKQGASETNPIEIWVAKGTYKPTAQVNSGDGRTATFQLQNHVAIYGGFSGNGTETTVEERDWVENATIFSGDIGVEGTDTDNAYHVFYHPDDLKLDATASLDGVTITKGYANDSLSSGGGMYNGSGSPTLTNVTMSGNTSSYSTGAIYNDSSKSIII